MNQPVSRMDLLLGLTPVRPDVWWTEEGEVTTWHVRQDDGSVISGVVADDSQWPEAFFFPHAPTHD